MSPDETFRIEHDSMGEVRVRADARWGAQTQRAVENFPISGAGLERSQIEALGRIKAAAAKVNGELGVVDADTAAAIRSAADEVASGEWDAHFPIDVFQTGSGTSSNMNANEVIASLASERLGRPVHPNDQVNASQSSNDVFPSSIHLAATSGVVQRADPRPGPPGRCAGGKARRVRIGRQVRSDPSDGRHAGDPGAGVRRLCGPGAARDRAAARQPAAPGGAAAGRHGGRDRHQHAGRVRRRGDRGAEGRHRPAAQRGARPLRGAGRARWPGRGIGPAADHRGRPLQDRQRPALDGLRAACRTGRDPPARTCSRAPRSCPAR